MDLEQIKSFLLVANTKSFTRAADSMNVVQSTVTTRIQMLERELGKELVSRDRRNISLTPAGRSFLPYAERILELSREGIKTVQLEQNFIDQLVVGSTHALWDYLLFDAIVAFQNTNPEISVRMVTEHSNIIIQKMMDGLIDLGIVFYPVHHPNLELIPIIEDTFELFADPTFQVPPVPLTPEDLRTLPFIHLNWGGSFSDWHRQIFGNHYIFPLEVDHVSLQLKFLKSKKGVGFLPRSVANTLIRQGVVVNIPFQTETPVPRRSIYLVKKKHKGNLVNMEKLAQYIKGVF